MALKESGENYLETILILKERLGCVRAIDVANELDFSKPSVSRAIGILKDEGLVKVEDGGHLELTKAGLAKANAVYDRHLVIADFLVDLGVDKKIAADDACRIEHILSEESFEKMKERLASNEQDD
ncbi:MAG: metal-dependent transcriptional regulator [Clostridiales Family XIII bacterium]|jgi:Mn-dependent DtxR family transcriptional regulator|nr:metal-dependent transcriptional regulator [Clostridiales Family XIII bacterium]